MHQANFKKAAARENVSHDSKIATFRLLNLNGNLSFPRWCDERVDLKTIKSFAKDSLRLVQNLWAGDGLT